MLIGKRVTSRIDNSVSAKRGVIVSEPFQKASGFYHGKPIEFYTAVTVLWDDGTMGAAIDVETLKVGEEVYIACAT